MKIGNKDVESIIITNINKKVLAVISDNEIIEDKNISVIVQEQLA